VDRQQTTTPRAPTLYRKETANEKSSTKKVLGTMTEKSSGLSGWGLAKATGSFLYDNKAAVGKVAKVSAKAAYENREAVKKGAEYAYENRETLKKAAKVAHENQDTVKAGLEWAAENEESVHKGAKYAYENRESLKKAVEWADENPEAAKVVVGVASKSLAKESRNSDRHSAPPQHHRRNEDDDDRSAQSVVKAQSGCVDCVLF